MHRHSRALAHPLHHLVDPTKIPPLGVQVERQRHQIGMATSLTIAKQTAIDLIGQPIGRGVFHRGRQVDDHRTHHTGARVSAGRADRPAWWGGICWAGCAGAMRLDQFDLHTLDERQHDGRRSKQALAERVGLSPLPGLLITGQSADDQLKVIVPNLHAYWDT